MIACHFSLRDLTCARYFENKNPRLRITTVPRHEISLSVLPIVSMMRNTTIAIKGSENIMIFLYLKQSAISNFTTVLNEGNEQLSISFSVNVRCSDWVVNIFILFFYILLTVHHVMILGKWPTWCTNYFLCVYFYLQLSTCFEHTVLIIRRDRLLEPSSNLHTSRLPT
jgi:hypothetical protein